MIYNFQKNEDGSILELQLLSEKYVLINKKKMFLIEIYNVCYNNNLKMNLS